MHVLRRWLILTRGVKTERIIPYKCCVVRDILTIVYYEYDMMCVWRAQQLVSRSSTGCGRGELGGRGGAGAGSRVARRQQQQQQHMTVSWFASRETPQLRKKEGKNGESTASVSRWSAVGFYCQFMRFFRTRKLDRTSAAFALVHGKVTIVSFCYFHSIYAFKKGVGHRRKRHANTVKFVPRFQSFNTWLVKMGIYRESLYC